MTEKKFDTPELTKFVDQLEMYSRQTRYATIMAAESIRVATVVRGAYKEGPPEGRRRFYGYGSTYTEAVLNAYREVHTIECHDWLEQNDQCVICDLLKTGFITYKITDDEVKIFCSNFNGRWVEG